MTDQLLTNPSTVEMTNAEVRRWTFDAALMLPVGTIPGTPVVTLIDISSGELYADGLSGAASIAGTIITPPLTWHLRAGHRYHQVYRVPLDNGETFTAVLQIDCTIDALGGTAPPDEALGQWDFSDSEQSGQLVTAGF